ncbi:DUF488 domain-containing protein [Aneurinibacillus sp. Ricciae_BoGa-3]|uniref:DUF488 domain-containing protein n=1 Tax=Aneurinibacillus sp. Ricciae_BoGa-3 TaxID=3022697 RepID=UPI0023415310|nr:DUF488 domain-containing protein [Aneurinibacillus sp. Ricciae_BoGa-3]WCK54453.1 DUF488 domain-containing protein [Aneurinibacillus sp. Ricciae_BoGa-3]
MGIQIKRIYEPPTPEDGSRILIDRVWPRGISKEQACIDLWLKEAAPSPELRKWFNHKPERFEAFRSRYEEELASDPVCCEAVKWLYEAAVDRYVTLLFAAKDTQHNHAVVLRDWVARKINARNK